MSGGPNGCPGKTLAPYVEGRAGETEFLEAAFAGIKGLGDFSPASPTDFDLRLSGREQPSCRAKRASAGRFAAGWEYARVSKMSAAVQPGLTTHKLAGLPPSPAATLAPLVTPANVKNSVGLLGFGVKVAVGPFLEASDTTV